MTIKKWKNIALLLLLIPLAACGGGGGGDAPPTQSAQQVEATVGLQGSGTVGAVELTIVLPAGFTLETDSSGQPTAAALVQLLQGGLLEVNYTPETAQASGMLEIGLINANGFAAGTDILKLIEVYPAGSVLPDADDFAVSAGVFDLNGAALPAVTATVGVNITPAP